jgi:photosystem II stability/assembly factor-like uncharacterized protein
VTKRIFAWERNMRKELTKSVLVAGCLLGVMAGEGWGQWEKTNGLNGVYARHLLVNGNVLFAATDGGVFRSTDNGDSWTAANNGLTYLRVSCFAADHSGNIFAGTSSGLFHSTDNGDSWNAVSQILTNNGIISGIVCSGNTILVGAYSRGVVRSSDNGRTWTELNNELTNGFINCLACNGGYFFAGTGDNKIYCSRDNGDTWTQVFDGVNDLGLLGPALNGIFCFTFSNGTIFAGTNIGIIRSTGDGTKWLTVNNGITNKDPYHVSKYVFSLLGEGKNVFAGTSNGYYFSTDTGTNWIALNNGLPFDDDIWQGSYVTQTIFSFALTGNFLFVGVPSGVWRFPFSRATHDSLFTLKIPVAGDSLNYAYTLLTSPSGMTVSPGGTISWTPTADSAYFEPVRYIVSDDNGRKDTVTRLISVSAAKPINAVKPAQRTTISSPADFSIAENPSSRSVTIRRPDHSTASDLCFYDLSGRVIDKITGVTSRTTSWKSGAASKGFYVLQVKSGAERIARKFLVR